MATMKAIRMHGDGGLDVLSYDEVVRPEPAAGEVRRAQELSQTGHARGKIVLEVGG